MAHQLNEGFGKGQLDLGESFLFQSCEQWILRDKAYLQIVQTSSSRIIPDFIFWINYVTMLYISGVSTLGDEYMIIYNHMVIWFWYLNLCLLSNLSALSLIPFIPVSITCLRNSHTTNITCSSSCFFSILLFTTTSDIN